MTKTTIELRRCDNHPAGYGIMDPLRADSPETMDRLLDWTSEAANADQKVYRHYVRYAEERIGELGEYDFKPGNWTIAHEPGHRIQRCNHVTYLDIYHQ